MSPNRLYPAVVSLALGLSVLSPSAWAQDGVFLADDGPFTADSSGVYASDKRNKQTDYTFTLTNDTSVEMVEFYASPQAASDWESNVLGDKTVQANGDWTTITLTSNRGCIYDFLAIFADGDKLEKYGIDVCELENHTYYDN